MADNRTDQEQATIEQDVVETQDEMGETVRELEDKLNPRDIAQSFMGDDATETAKEALEVARRNPLPVALIAVGAVWLFATSEAPMIRDIRERFTGRGGTGGKRSGLRSRAAEPAPIGPPPASGEAYDRRGTGI